MHRLVLFFLLIALPSSGCNLVHRAGKTPTIASGRTPFQRLVAHRTERGGAAFEIAVIPVPRSARGQLGALWQALDSQALDLETRQLLDRNGIRIGVSASRMPPSLLALVKWTEPVAGDPDNDPDGDPKLQESRSLGSFAVDGGQPGSRLEQLDPAEEYWIACSPLYPELVWSVDLNDESKSGVCPTARCGITLGLKQSAANQASITLRPEIRFGDSRMRYGVGDGEFVYETRQEQLPLPELAFSIDLQAGRTLVIASTPAGQGIGHSLFASPDGDDPGPSRLLLIRPVNVRDNDLFTSRGKTRRRLATNLE